MPLCGVALSAAMAAASCASGKTDQPRQEAEEALQLRQKIIELSRTERAINQEYALARNPAPYLVVDLPNNKIELKARGRPLRSFVILEIRRTGAKPATDSAWSMQEKRPLQQTDRPKVRPGEGEQAAVEAAKQELWGPQKMPPDFDLFCDEDRILEIRALPSEDSHWRIVRGITTLYRRTADWWRHRRSPQYENRYLLQLWLAEKESQVLCWALPKQLKILVREHS